ncbi:MAG: hypothetical protein IKL79_04115 [Clostridia bacterium]|nr:hypothetical protein [Clostridia bacterium]
MIDLIDFHSHVLPRADHGSASVNTSLSQLSMARLAGVSRVFATPHFYPAEQDVSRFLARRQGSYANLLKELDDSFPKIALGAEVLICDNIEALPGIRELCIEGTDTLLLELPFNDFDKRYRTSVAALIKQGINVVLAHADRYDRANIDSLLSVGAKIQLNANSLSGLFVKKHLYEWIDAGLVVGLGSDIHGADKRAYKCFSSAIRKMGEKRAEKIMTATMEIFSVAADTK